MKKLIPNFRVDTGKGYVSLIFQTTSHTCILKFANESFTVDIDGSIVFSADKL
jgi:hypothetical protein